MGNRYTQFFDVGDLSDDDWIAPIRAENQLKDKMIEVLVWAVSNGMCLHRVLDADDEGSNCVRQYLARKIFVPTTHFSLHTKSMVIQGAKVLMGELDMLIHRAVMLGTQIRKPNAHKPSHCIGKT